jgi:hypothetical protein
VLRSPFDGLKPGPAADAVAFPVGRPSGTAFGCFGVAIVFLGLVAVAALTFAARGGGGAPAVGAVAWVAGVLFGLAAVGLAVAAVRAVRERRGLALDRAGLWWLDRAGVTTLPWAEIAAARLVPGEIRLGRRRGAARPPSLELCPVEVEVLRRTPALRDQVVAGAPWRDGGPGLWLRFALAPTTTAADVEAALRRHCPDAWAAGTATTPTD